MQSAKLLVWITFRNTPIFNSTFISNGILFPVANPFYPHIAVAVLKIGLLLQLARPGLALLWCIFDGISFLIPLFVDILLYIISFVLMGIFSIEEYYPVTRYEY